MKKRSLKVFVFAIIASLFIYVVFFDGLNKIYTKINAEAYGQYSISFNSEISKEAQGKIKNDLEKVETEIKRKRFIFKDKNSDFQIIWGESASIIPKYYVPIAHIYSVEDNFIPEKQKIYTYASYPENVLRILKEKYPGIIKVEDPNIFLDQDTKNVALVSFEDLSYKNKLLNFNGRYFLDDTKGGIKIGLGLNPLDPFVENIINTAIRDEISSISFDKTKLGTINQTGVTAITRGLATKINNSGNFGYPALKIAEFLKNTDLTHVSNEVSSVPGCLYRPSAMVFCAKPEYIKTLQDIGVDIVELTGNHNNDYGAKNNTSTIEKYTELGMRYFGGGLSTTDAEKILYEKVKDTKIAFLGYNYYDTMQKTPAIAGENRAGANSYSEEKIKNDIANARKNADVIILDIQFEECYSYPKTSASYIPCYKPLGYPDQASVFRKAIDAGADIVVGTQAHQPQTYELYNGKLIFYGLGNLFFDQTRWEGTKQGLILTHYLYNGKLIQTKLTTTYYKDDMQVYVTKGGERTYLLNLLKQGRTK